MSEEGKKKKKKYLIIALDKEAWENITDKRKASLSKWGQKVFYYQIKVVPYHFICLQDVYNKDKLYKLDY